MPREFSRKQRVSEQIKKEMSTILNQDKMDGAGWLGMVTVSAVDLSKNFSLAKVYVTFLNTINIEFDSVEVREKIDYLNKISGHARGLLSARLRMKRTPTIKFCFDASIAQGSYVSSLIDSAIRKENASSHKLKSVEHVDSLKA